LRQAAEGSITGIPVQWTSNFDDGEKAAIGRTLLVLQMPSQTLRVLIGSGTRIWTNGQGERSEPLSVRIELDGKVVFNDMYGPYDPTCRHVRSMRGRMSGFIIVDTGGSIEVMHSAWIEGKLH
jgi:hypothetical protein